MCASPTYDAVILGAGAAGLAAAAEFARSGKSALVLEARDRIGGRVWSLEVSGLPVPVELGAEFIHGRPRATLSRMRRAGIAAIDAPIVRMAIADGKLRPRDDALYTEVRRFLRRHAATLARKDVSFGAFLAHAGHGLSAAARTFARMRVQGYDAAEPARASARAIAEEWNAEAEGRPGHFRPRGGYGALLDWLAAGLDGSRVELRLQSVVRAVRWKRGAVELAGTSQGKAFGVTARRAIVTLPLGVLKLPPHAPGAVRFTPSLREKRAALDRLESGAVIKAALLFRTAFWEELEGRRYREISFFHSPRAPFPTFWTAHPERVPLLVAWAGGPKAARLAKAAAPDIVRGAAASLASILGVRSRVDDQLAATWVHHWQRDPFALGAYSYVAVGGAGARRALAEPLEDTLYFAGEAADYAGEHGTVAGALASGARAARAALRR